MSFTTGTVEQIARALHPDIAPPRGIWWNVRGVCHNGDSVPPKGGTLGLRDGDRGGLGVKCFKGCDRQLVLHTLQAETGLRVCRCDDCFQAWRDGKRPRSSSPRTAPQPRTPSKPDAAPTNDYAAQLWACSEMIPLDETHPARLWLAARKLWRPGHPRPNSLCWLPRRALPRKALLPNVAGALVVPIAPLADWLGAWPACPENVASIQLVYVDANGVKAYDSEGRDKRNFGPHAGRGWAIPSLYHPAAGLRVCEGIADALGVAARRDALVFAVVGVSAMSSPPDDLLDVARVVREAGGEIVVHADPDSGEDPAAALAHHLCGRAVIPVAGDPAEAASESPFGNIDVAAARHYADTLRELYPDAPHWEIVRQTALIIEEPFEAIAERHQGVMDAAIGRRSR